MKLTTWELVKKDNGLFDLSISKAGIYTITGTKAVRQELKNKLKLFHGEWFLHEDEGVLWLRRDNFDGLVGSKDGAYSIDPQIKDIINSDKYIKKLNSYKSTFDNRTGLAEIKISCTDIYENDIIY